MYTQKRGIRKKELDGNNMDRTSFIRRNNLRLLRLMTFSKHAYYIYRLNACFKLTF